MDVTPLIKQGQSIIQSYADGRFRIGGTLYEGAVLVFPGHVEPWESYAGGAELTHSDFKDLIVHAPRIDVVLLGTGKGMYHLPPALKVTLKDHGLRIESMPTGAACRTFNVLVAEGRRVVAALVPV